MDVCTPKNWTLAYVWFMDILLIITGTQNVSKINETNILSLGKQ